MKVSPQEVYLHGLGKFPDYVYSVDISSVGGRVYLVTGGADSVARVWTLDASSMLVVHSELTGHSLGVNCVRFSPDGLNYIATGSDDGKIVIWKQMPHFEILGDVRWVAYKVCNCLDEVVDVCWSPCGQMVVGAAQREMSHIFNIHTGRTLQRLDGHTNRVLGVTWDPLGQLIVSQSTDRTARVYARSKRGTWYVKAQLKEWETAAAKSKLFMSDSHYPSDPTAHFFRRPQFSPDGSMVVLPGGLFGSAFAVHLYSRRNLVTNASPTATFSTACSPALAVRFHPRKFVSELPDVSPFYVYAVTTGNSFYVLRSDKDCPIAFGTDLHCTSLVDAAWSGDAETLALVSTDGYMTIVRFDRNELGGTPDWSDYEVKKDVVSLVLVPRGEVSDEDIISSPSTPGELIPPYTPPSSFVQDTHAVSPGLESPSYHENLSSVSPGLELPEYPEKGLPVITVVPTRRRIKPVVLTTNT